MLYNTANASHSHLNTDLNISICLKLNDSDIFNMSLVNKYYYNLLNSEVFWMNKTLIRFKKYPDLVNNNIRAQYNLTWKEYYQSISKLIIKTRWGSVAGIANVAGIAHERGVAHVANVAHERGVTNHTNHANKPIIPPYLEKIYAVILLNSVELLNNFDLNKIKDKSYLSFIDKQCQDEFINPNILFHTDFKSYQDKNLHKIFFEYVYNSKYFNVNYQDLGVSGIKLICDYAIHLLAFPP